MLWVGASLDSVESSNLLPGFWLEDDMPAKKRNERRPTLGPTASWFALLAATTLGSAYADTVTAEVTLDDIRRGQPLPAIGTAHGHVRLASGLLARIAYAHEGDPTAAARLQAQAAAFRHLEPVGRTPKLHGVVEPGPGLPGGALIVDFVEGHAPDLPGDLAAMAETLARIHALPMPPSGSPIPRQTNPFLETLQAIELNTRNFLGAAVEDPQARAEIADELWAMREAAATLDLDDQLLGVALADTHPGNFIVDRAGIARFVDLEKVHVGSAAIDLAHATLRTSTLWDPRVGKELAPADVVGFYEAYLARRGEAAGRVLVGEAGEFVVRTLQFSLVGY